MEKIRIYVRSRRSERRWKIRAEAKDAFHRSSRCSQAVRKQCTVPCKALRELQRAYGTGEEAKILLQPFGVRGQDSGEELQIQYDVLKSEFQPAMQQHSYSQEEILFIQEHIGRFHLNDPQYRSGKLMEFIRNVIDGEGRMPAYEYNNLVVELFAEKLKPLERAEILKICEKIYIAGFLSA